MVAFVSAKQAKPNGHWTLTPDGHATDSSETWPIAAGEARVLGPIGPILSALGGSKAKMLPSCISTLDTENAMA
jgi:hypothetical protein